jgi:hypothetical protein
LVPLLIGTLKRTIPMEIRTAPDSGAYLEGVLVRENLKPCVDLLHQSLGPPAKPFGEQARFDGEMQRVVDRLGGVWVTQCLFLKPIASQQVAYAALWPWRVDSQRVTLKVGTVDR